MKVRMEQDEKLREIAERNGWWVSGEVWQGRVLAALREAQQLENEEIAKKVEIWTGSMYTLAKVIRARVLPPPPVKEKL